MSPLTKDPTQRALIVAAVVVVVALGAFFLLRSAPDEEIVTDEGPAPPTATPLDPAVETVTVDLYFPGEDGRLQAESRELPDPGEDLEQQATAIVEALLAGPSESGLMTGLVAPLPEDVALGRAYVLGEPALDNEDVTQHSDVTMLVDFAAPGPTPPLGSLGEMLTVYSIVHSVILNIDGVEKVILTWNGTQPSTFAGHLDTSRPLTLNHPLMGEI